MDPEQLFKFFNPSLQNHIDYTKIEKKKKYHYVIEYNGLQNRYDIIQQIMLHYPSATKITKNISISNDGIYTKCNKKVTIHEVLFSTKTLELQQNISLTGYSLHEKQVKVFEELWGDDDNENITNDPIVHFKKEKIQEYVVLKTELYEILITLEKITILFNIDNEDIKPEIFKLIQILLLYIYIGYRFVLTLEHENKIRNHVSFKLMKNEQHIFSYKYLLKKKDVKSVLIKNYFLSLPAIRFNINGEVFLLDCYDNLRKIENTDKEDHYYIDEGFMFHDSSYISLDEEQFEYNYNLQKNDAFLYYDLEKREYSIYTHSSSIYRDVIENEVFTRYSFLNNNAQHIKFLFFSKKAMDSKHIKEIQEIVDIFQMQSLVKRFCKDLDIDFLNKLPESYKKVILTESKKIKNMSLKNNWIADFFCKFLSYEYDESKPIILNLKETPNDLSAKIISKKELQLYTILEKEKIEINVFDNSGKDKKKSEYYSAITKFLEDQSKIYGKELEKRVRGSITNSWMKCWEMINIFQLVPKDHLSTFTVFCNAEFPGSFILALNHYIKTETKNKKFEWYANSIWPTEELKASKKEIYKDSFKLYEKYPKRWMMTPENGGDVTDLKMITIINEQLAHKVDLYTSDVSTGLENQEEIGEARAHLGQIICGLKLLKNGGTMVCRTFMFFKPFSMSLIRILTDIFDECFITKPMISRPASSEIYIVCKGYKIDENIINNLEQVLSHWSENTIDTYLVPIAEDFYLKMVYALYYVYDRQLHFLKKNMEITKKLYEINKEPKSVSLHLMNQTGQIKEYEFRKSIIDHWKVMFPVPYLPKEDDL